MKTLLNLLVIILITGCATRIQPYQVYPSGTPNSEQPIKLSGYVGSGKGLLSIPAESWGIICIDGQSLMDVWNGYDNGLGYPDRILVTPGIHRLTTRWVLGPNYVNADLWFEAISGREYKLMTKASNYSVRTWIVDAENETPVGGSRSSDPTPGPLAKYCP